MLDEEKAIVRSLIPVAWADGEFGDNEREMVRGLLEAYRASAEESAEIFAFAESKPGLDSIVLEDLSAGDRRLVLAHAVTLTFVDGAQDDSERAFLEELGRTLRIPDDEARDVVTQATARATQHLDDLKS